MKLHDAGKTDEAKADLARLKVIREQRAAEAARRQVSISSSFFFSFLTMRSSQARGRCVCRKLTVILGREGREGREGEGTAGGA